MDRRIIPGLDALFCGQSSHFIPASASSTGLPLFRPFQSTPVLLPPLASMAPMPPLAPMAPLLPPLAILAPMPMLPLSVLPATSSVAGWGNFQTSNHPNVSSSSIGHPNSGRAKVRMGFSIEDILNSDPAQQPGMGFDIVLF